MAMEVNQSKQLHLQAFPLILLSLTIGIFSAMSLLMAQHTKLQVVAQTWFGKAVKVEPKPNGLAEFHWQVNEKAVADQPLLGVSDIGQTADQGLSLEAIGSRSITLPKTNGAGGESRTPVTSLEN